MKVRETYQESPLRQNERTPRSRTSCTQSTQSSLNEWAWFVADTGKTQLRWQLGGSSAMEKMICGLYLGVSCHEESWMHVRPGYWILILHCGQLHLWHRETRKITFLGVTSFWGRSGAPTSNAASTSLYTSLWWMKLCMAAAWQHDKFATTILL